MADFELKADTALQTVINKDASLADGARAAGDYDNSTALDPLCDAYLEVQYDTSTPTVGDTVAKLYLLTGDGAATEEFPEGGDGTVGNDVDPQQALFVGSFETRNPSTSALERLELRNVPLGADTNRFVLKNVSGITFSLEYQLDIKPHKLQSV